MLFSDAAQADVKTGVDAWTQGDYDKAVAEWRPLANAGDPDAQFNIGQAYKLGRGVPLDTPIAMEWFRKAAAKGHIRAEDNYGLLLFQQKRQQEALPFLRKSADRGEPRAQYILGTAYFNGEFVTKDWVQAYALMTRAAASGLAPANASLQQMNNYIPADQRKKGLALAEDLATRNKATLAAATGSPPAAPITKPAPRPAKPVAVPVPPAPKPVAVAAATPKPKPAPVKPITAPSSAPASGDWRVQLGAFSEEARATALWSNLSKKVSGLSAYRPFYVKGGAVTRLQVGPLGSSADAEKLCKSIKAAGTDCIPKKA
ncbi:MAG: SPOR domain-containing protein [Sphingobium sp.]|uniref:SPOR domain-containing protein n=1 Tax=Sphingobium sp. TaxID=1912891 RepID=UPI0029AAE8A4|nr:SPOR domain-containing protein [Sphingobium sp.]MDX3910376.1 SPOR domain-containing protein [Sphingobium sp.]